MATNSWSFIQNINNCKVWIWKKKLFNLINQQPDIDRSYLYAADPYEAKYQFLVDKRESAGLKHLKNSEAFTEYSNDLDYIYKILKNTIQIKNAKYQLFLMIWFLICLVIKSLIQ